MPKLRGKNRRNEKNPLVPCDPELLREINLYGDDARLFSSADLLLKFERIIAKGKLSKTQLESITKDFFNQEFVLKCGSYEVKFENFALMDNHGLVAVSWLIILVRVYFLKFCRVLEMANKQVIHRGMLRSSGRGKLLHDEDKKEKACIQRQEPIVKKMKKSSEYDAVLIGLFGHDVRQRYEYGQFCRYVLDLLYSEWVAYMAKFKPAQADPRRKKYEKNQKHEPTAASTDSAIREMFRLKLIGEKVLTGGKNINEKEIFLTSDGIAYCFPPKNEDQLPSRQTKECKYLKIESIVKRVVASKPLPHGLRQAKKLCQVIIAK